MKKLILSLVITLSVLSCSFTKKPEFVGLQKVKVIDSNSKLITLSANALFKNPNNIGGKLKTNDLRVYINNTKVAIVNSEEFKVPSKKEFKIPLTVTIPIDSIIDTKSLGGLLGSLLSQGLKVQYKGNIDYKILGYSSTYIVNKTQDVKIKF